MLGENVKKIIKQKGMSIYDIAFQMNTTNQNLYRILQKDSIDSKYLVQIASILKIPIGMFFGEIQSNPDYYTYYKGIQMLFERLISVINVGEIDDIKHQAFLLREIADAFDKEVIRIREEAINNTILKTEK